MEVGGIGHDAAVEHLDPPGQARRDALVVGDQGDGDALVVEVVEEGQDGGTGDWVEVAGRPTKAPAMATR